MKRGLKVSTIILIIVCFAGLSLLLYPSFAEFWNQNFTTRMISDYSARLEEIEEEDYEEIWSQAIQYNERLAELKSQFDRPEDMTESYPKMLTIDDEQIMGYIEIPKLDLMLTVSHGTSTMVLETGVGHLEWSSLPTGGVSTHCVLSGHRGLPSARLFTDLDRMEVGDEFILSILGETLTYETDQIRIVEPDEISDLTIVEDMDYCTLVTCTPYGVNTHRLLIRGHRIANEREGARVVADAVIIDNKIVALVIAMPTLITLFLVVMLKKPKSKIDVKKILQERIEADE